ncbi:MAG: carboxypeptidase regulatory-like domain-containing protein [Deltaproteobacteria bacterium]|uniref:Carboxypeptidase regulatory-like domain-containing protein n=1 Tax=Candidatus Zymogenus saltonus TaxID=2844893 RepID=A0A9D8KEE8_9DELT|nr:carboxypeptidase regulatory-like domain-containing protein [Candidatus Zymogenus saltonus]
MEPMWEKIIVGAVFSFMSILLPIVPAYILYKFLPSKASAKGPFKGLSLQLKGAFAAYFLLFISLSGMLVAYLLNTKSESEIYDLWKIRGWVKLEEDGDESMVNYTISPEILKVDPGKVGNFIITGVPLPAKTSGVISPTKLTIEMEGYETIEICLDKRKPGVSTDYEHETVEEVKFDEISKTITINSSSSPIIQRKLKEKYNPNPPPTSIEKTPKTTYSNNDIVRGSIIDVTTEGNTKPIENIPVTLCNSKGEDCSSPVYTDSKGMYYFYEVPPGDYILKIWINGYEMGKPHIHKVEVSDYRKLNIVKTPHTDPKTFEFLNPSYTNVKSLSIVPNDFKK